jgi:cytoskeletal protein RodZ
MSGISDLWEEAKKHPIVGGVIAVGVGLLILYLLGFFTGGSSNSSSTNDASYYAAVTAQDNANAAQTISNNTNATQVQVASINANVEQAAIAANEATVTSSNAAAQTLGEQQLQDAFALQSQQLGDQVVTAQQAQIIQGNLAALQEGTQYDLASAAAGNGIY